MSPNGKGQNIIKGRSSLPMIMFLRGPDYHPSRFPTPRHFLAYTRYTKKFRTTAVGSIFGTASFAYAYLAQRGHSVPPLGIPPCPRGCAPYETVIPRFRLRISVSIPASLRAAYRPKGMGHRAAPADKPHVPFSPCCLLPALSSHHTLAGRNSGAPRPPAEHLLLPPY